LDTNQIIYIFLKIKHNLIVLVTSCEPFIKQSIIILITDFSFSEVTI